jgi:hypothetical protein
VGKGFRVVIPKGSTIAVVSKVAKFSWEFPVVAALRGHEHSPPNAFAASSARRATIETVDPSRLGDTFPIIPHKTVGAD